jgi:hypothetical protein
MNEAGCQPQDDQATVADAEAVSHRQYLGTQIQKITDSAMQWLIQTQKLKHTKQGRGSIGVTQTHAVEKTVGSNTQKKTNR